MRSGVPNWAATTIAGEWQSGLTPDFIDLDEGFAEFEAANLARHYKHWHVSCLGHMDAQQPDEIF